MLSRSESAASGLGGGRLLTHRIRGTVSVISPRPDAEACIPDARAAPARGRQRFADRLAERLDLALNIQDEVARKGDDALHKFRAAGAAVLAVARFAAAAKKTEGDASVSPSLPPRLAPLPPPRQGSFGGLPPTLSTALMACSAAFRVQRRRRANSDSDQSGKGSDGEGDGPGGLAHLGGFEHLIALAEADAQAHPALYSSAPASPSASSRSRDTPPASPLRRGAPRGSLGALSPSAGPQTPPLSRSPSPIPGGRPRSLAGPRVKPSPPLPPVGPPPARAPPRLDLQKAAAAPPGPPPAAKRGSIAGGMPGAPGRNAHGAATHVSFFETGLLRTRPSYSRPEVKELAEIFLELDKNGTGDVEKRELLAFIAAEPEEVKTKWRLVFDDILAIFARSPHQRSLYFDQLLTAVYPWASPQQIAIMLSWCKTGPGAVKLVSPSAHRQVLTEEQLGEVRALFDLYDTKSRGVLTLEDFMRAGGASGLTEEDLRDMFSRLDEDGNRYMTLDEFTRMCEVLYVWKEQTAVEAGWLPSADEWRLAQARGLVEHVPGSHAAGRHAAPTTAAARRLAHQLDAAVPRARRSRADSLDMPRTAEAAQSPLTAVLQQSLRPLSSYQTLPGIGPRPLP